MSRAEAPRAVDKPEPGYFLLRLVRGGPHVAARILHDDGQWQAIIDGVAADPHADPAQAVGVFRIWHGGRRCTQAEYDYRLSLKSWAVAAMPQHPAAQPRQPIDLASLPPVI